MDKDPALASGPTPVFRAVSLEASASDAELWVKNDGLSSATYGGNKARKLALILTEAERRGAERILTVGAAGSHHALATAVFARARGLRAAAVLGPQPRSAHAEQTLRDAIASGLEVYPAPRMATVPIALMRARRRGDYFVPPGGSSVLGACGYAEAARELAEQIRSSSAPAPDVIVVPVGSGGTAAGLLAGIVREGLECRLVGVQIGALPALARPLIVSLAARVGRKLGHRLRVRDLTRRLVLEQGYAGRGYGWATAEGALATEAASALGLGLDPTYTAKTFAKALALIASPALPGAAARARSARSVLAHVRGRPPRVLYWHTLSAQRPAGLSGPLIGSSDLPHTLAALFFPSEV